MNQKPFILDCSTTMSWCFKDEFNEYSKLTLNYCNKFTVTVPPLWKLEITSALLIAEKRSRINIADSTRFIDLLNTLPINISDLSFSTYELINVARSNNLTSYDTAYLMLAMHEELPMTTNDKALIKACHNNDVSLLNISNKSC